MPVLRLTLFSALTLGTTLANAADNLAAHQHGHATLQVALDGPALSILMTSPGHNLFGFEHEPVTTEEHAQVRSAIDWLTQTPLVDTDASSCRVIQASVESGFDNHTELPQDHDRGHSDLEVTQEVHCDSLPDDGGWQSPLPHQFPQLQQLEVEWLSNEGQGSARLTPDSNHFQVPN